MLIALFFALLGLMGMVTWGSALLRVRRLSRTGRRAEAVVVDLDEEDDDGVAYFPIVRFRTDDGQDVMARTRLGSSVPLARPGERVRVVYQPASPQDVAVDTVKGRGGVLSALVFLMALALLAIAVILWVR